MQSKATQCNTYLPIRSQCVSIHSIAKQLASQIKITTSVHQECTGETPSQNTLVYHILDSSLIYFCILNFDWNKYTWLVVKAFRNLYCSFEFMSWRIFIRFKILVIPYWSHAPQIPINRLKQMCAIRGVSFVIPFTPGFSSLSSRTSWRPKSPEVADCCWNLCRSRVVLSPFYNSRWLLRGSLIPSSQFTMRFLQYPHSHQGRFLCLVIIMLLLRNTRHIQISSARKAYYKRSHGHHGHRSFTKAWVDTGGGNQRSMSLWYWFHFPSSYLERLSLPWTVK